MSASTKLLSRLSKCSKVEVISSGSDSSGWQARGSGTVSSSLDENKLSLLESGQLEMSSGSFIKFNNTSIFEIKSNNSIELKSLKPDSLEAASLLLLHFVSETQWRSFSPHICGDDEYSCEIELSAAAEIRIVWTVLGRKKKERVNKIFW